MPTAGCLHPVMLTADTQVNTQWTGGVRAGQRKRRRENWSMVKVDFRDTDTHSGLFADPYLRRILIAQDELI